MSVVRRAAPGSALVLWALACAGPAPDPAEAGAWTREPGSLQLITNFGRRGAPFRAGPDDEPVETATTQLYAEYGLIEGLTVGGKFWADIAPANPDGGSAALGAFVRKRLWRTDSGHVASVQLGGQVPVEGWIGERFGRSKPFSTTEIAFRALYGKSWWGDWGNAFLSTAGGYQLRFDGLPDELRLDVTAGVEPFECCMAMLAVYGLMPLSPGLTDRSVRLAPSAVWHVRRPEEDAPERRSTSLQFGVVYDLLQPEDGIGLIMGVWQEF